jgi:hypothetical protein
MAHCLNHTQLPIIAPIVPQDYWLVLGNGAYNTPTTCNVGEVVKTAKLALQRFDSAGGAGPIQSLPIQALPGGMDTQGAPVVGTGG